MAKANGTGTTSTTTAAKTTATYQIRALDRGLDILEAFTIAEPELSIGQIAERTGLPKPTIVRLLSVLIDRSYVERVPQSEHYRLGVRTLEIGSIFLQSTSLEREARPIMQRLADATGQTANLGILDHFDVIHIEVVAPDRPVRFWARIGKREEAYVSGLGKVLLAGLPAQVRERYVRTPKVALTPRTLTDPDALRAELERVRERGLALDDEESNTGVRCVAAPIFNGTGRLVAAVSISGAVAEFESPGQMEHYIDQVRAAAAEISGRLGWTEETPRSS
ncbi:MAG TPA: IclR family transcriptional regulator [Thermomicrobiales bacterium]|nr:IclR family transcriptional regulator [Thermomicrobiales bacterium]